VIRPVGPGTDVIRHGQTRQGSVRFEALLDLVTAGVLVLDRQAVVTACNPAAETIVRRPVAAICGRDAIDLLVPERLRQVVRERFATLRTHQQTWEGIGPIVRGDDTTVRCVIRARALAPSPGDAALSGAGAEVVPAGGTGLSRGAHRGEAAPVSEDDRADPEPQEFLVVFTPLDAAPDPALLRAERAVRSELEHARDRLAFVANAGGRLASSLDVSMTYETVGTLVVPRFGQLCVIDLWDGRSLDRAYVHDSEAADDPTHQELVEQIRALGGKQTDEDPAVRAALTARPVVVERATAERLAAMYHPDACEVVARATRGRGLVAIPLITRGRVLGVLSLFGPGCAYGRELAAGEDLPLLEQVASRAAQSIENARLFNAERRLARHLQESERRQRRAALTLQRSLLPAVPYRPGDLEVATRYFPGTAETEVGGDWYDVIPLTTGRTALVIGDVMGRGLRAATLMGQVRTAVRAYGRQDLRPKEILALLDGIVADLGEAEIVTCVYAVFDSLECSLSYASAGHLPLLVVDGRGRARRLDHETGLPLGVGAGAAPEHAVSVTEDMVVAFYTDGLVENRHRDVDAGIDQLVEALGLARGTLEGMCDQVIDALRPPTGYDDDVALLLASARH